MMHSFYSVVSLVSSLLLLRLNLPLALAHADTHSTGNEVDAGADEDQFSLFEGDIAGYQPTEGALYSGVTKGENLWPDRTIPYEISNVYSAKDKQTILNAIHDFQQKTCIRFRPKQAGDEYSIYIDHMRSGCFAFWGRQTHSQLRYHNRGTGLRNQQLVNLQRNGCLGHGTIQHELMHTVGFLHEQSRKDRDDYVDILWQNIQPGKDDQFRKQSDSDAQGTPYDFGSVMHYHKDAFSRKAGQLDTIRPKAKFHGKTLGQRHGLSPVDVQKINRLYKCQAAPSPSPSPAPAPAPAPTPAPSGGKGSGTRYTVQSGDTLTKIAAKFGKTWRQIARDNGITDPDYLHEGQVLLIK
ncbi:hatching enzyme 1.2-like [Paramacrobiotus metropolitanus]|uniref:hatching enzyme 1.2-like n=1 Tax=Paramacrobiotus metropolitanus TaxID=2943436 RepID=UPI0024463EE7|nr:hatching enzyme 1.2-like [Paramacrobiotus metropolitanus]